MHTKLAQMCLRMLVLDVDPSDDAFVAYEGMQACSCMYACRPRGNRRTLSDVCTDDLSKDVHGLVAINHDP